MGLKIDYAIIEKEMRNVATRIAEMVWVEMSAHCRFSTGEGNCSYDQYHGDGYSLHECDFETCPIIEKAKEKEKKVDEQDSTDD